MGAPGLGALPKVTSLDRGVATGQLGPRGGLTRVQTALELLGEPEEANHRAPASTREDAYAFGMGARGGTHVPTRVS